MKQIVDKLNNIAKAIDENVELPTTDLIVDSLDAITRAYGGTPSESNLIVDKLEDIEEVAHGGITPTGNIEITENTTEPLDVAQYATATVNVPAPAPEKHYVIPEGTYSSVDMMGMLVIPFSNLYFYAPILYVNFDGNQYTLQPEYSVGIADNGVVKYQNDSLMIFVTPDYEGLGVYSGTAITTGDTVPTQHTISAYYLGEERYWQCAHPLNYNGLPIWANTCEAGTTDMTFVRTNTSEGNYSPPIYQAITKEQGGIQIGRLYGISQVINNKAVFVTSVIGATRTGTNPYYITNTGNLIYVNLQLSQ